MEQVFLTEEEKKQLLDIQLEENEIITQLGQIEYQIQNLELQKDSLTEALVNFNKRRRNIASVLQEKYGDGTFNLDSGEFIKNS
jgi:hypothetical protein